MKRGNLVHVIVNENVRDCYYPENLHDAVGIVDDVDDKHIWIILIMKDCVDRSYMSSPSRYCLCDISIDNISCKGGCRDTRSNF